MLTSALSMILATSSQKDGERMDIGGERIDSPAKISSSSEEPVFHKGTNGLRSDGTWNKQNYLPLNLSVSG